MQLKGLVRFFTILLIIYSLYQLSFTWFVRNHEKKMEARAQSYVKSNYESAIAKYPGNKDSQAIYQETLDKAYQESVIPSNIKKRLVVEAGIPFGWDKYAGDEGEIIGMNRFGASAPYKVLAEKFGFTGASVIAKAEEYLSKK